jgi:hypothetical protein
MSTTEYEKVLHRVYHLTAAERLRLLADLSTLVQPGVIPQSRSVMELQGLGKDIWSDVDPEDYIEEERASWNG